jgi:hypothetical protein
MMPLPRLKVLRETYCSQQVVDTAIGYAETHRPELIENLMEEEHWRQQAYSERGWDGHRWRGLSKPCGGAGFSELLWSFRIVTKTVGYVTLAETAVSERKSVA